MQFLMIVNDSAIARYVSRNGVDRLFVDLEVIGKAERQAGMNTWKSGQTIADVARLREAAPDAHLLVRINPPYEGTRDEVKAVIARGADSIMLPMFRSAEDVARLADMVAGHAEVVPLVETRAALDDVPRMAAMGAAGRVHIGLNDLHLDMGLRFMFQPISEGLLEDACAALRAHSLPFGIGGLARAHEGHISPDVLLGEHVRLGSDAAILSRTFHRGAASVEEIQSQMDFAAEVAELRRIWAGFRATSAEELQANRVLVKHKIDTLEQTMPPRTGATR